VEILSVRNLNKSYGAFRLRDVSFSLEPGYIMGFIGRNGAGKTTTMKLILNLVHADGGEVRVMGEDFREKERLLKPRIGFALGGVDYYPRRRLRDIAAVVRRFYTDWSDAVFERYLRRFGLDQDKRVVELSSGMSVKFSLALALSHDARLLILDEPTSGLDPVSRDEMLELFQEIIQDGERAILFSTQITSDLEKCADYITYIKDGAILASREKDELAGSFKVVKGPAQRLTPELRRVLIGWKENGFGFSGLMRAEDLPAADALETLPADLETIMIYHEKERPQ
jgi:ABC-2 type transport system ATP-binding protein